MNRATEAVLDGQSRIANWLYNHLLEKANDLRDEFRRTQSGDVAQTLYTKRGLRDQVPKLKEDHPFLKTVYSSPLKNAALRLSRAIQDYQKGRRGERKKPVSWPKFRSWKQAWFSLLYDEPWKGYALSGRALTLSLGKDERGKQIQLSLELKESLPARVGHEDVKQLRITKDAGQLYAVFTVERTLAPGKERKKVVALDPNHKNLAYGVGTDGRGIEIANPWFLKDLDRRIDALKSRRDRCQKKAKKITRADGSSFWLPSRRWRYFNELLQKAHRLRRDQTKHYLFTVANRLYRDYDVVSIGDYTPHGGGISTGMRRAMNNQSLIGRFKKVCSWVGARSGKSYEEWREYGSTRTCSVCGLELEGSVPPEQRLWECPGCHAIHVRDENAAVNGLRRTLQKLQLSCSDLLGDGGTNGGNTSGDHVVRTRGTWRFDGLGISELPGVVGGRVFDTASAVKELNAGTESPAPRHVYR